MSVKFDLTGLNNLKKFGHASSDGSRRGMNVIAHVYLSFIRTRYNKFSRGGGNWKPLKAATIKAKKSTTILKDNGILFNALTPNANGNLLEVRGGKRVRVGFSNATYAGGGGVTYQQLAAFHDEGAGNLPQRKIFVEPDDKAKARMRKVLQIVINEIGNKGN